MLELAGDDILFGGAGNDVLFGGDGFDAFFFSSAADMIKGGLLPDAAPSWAPDVSIALYQQVA